MTPTDMAWPLPCPNLRQTAAFPLVFHGTAGLRRTSLGMPMRSYSRRASITSVTRNVVHICSFESVSSNATYI